MQVSLNNNTKNLKNNKSVFIFQHTKFFNNNNKLNHLYLIDHFNKLGIKKINFFFSKETGVFNYYNKKEILSTKFFTNKFNNIFLIDNNITNKNITITTSIKIPTSEFNDKYSNLYLSFKKYILAN